MFDKVLEFDETTGEYFSRPANEFDGYDPNYVHPNTKSWPEGENLPEGLVEMLENNDFAVFFSDLQPHRYSFSKYSSKGHDWSIALTCKNTLKSLYNAARETYNNWDAGEEASYYMRDGHGVNGAPEDPIVLIEDMKECGEFINEIAEIVKAFENGYVRMPSEIQPSNLSTYTREKYDITLFSYASEAFKALFEAEYEKEITAEDILNNLGDNETFADAVKKSEYILEYGEMYLYSPKLKELIEDFCKGEDLYLNNPKQNNKLPTQQER